MKISVIAPVLNEARYLPMFLNSILHQTHKNHELILVDGGSTDETVTLAQGKAKIVVDTKRNFGHCRNVGAQHASGDIHFQTSADTYFEPTLFERIVNHYQQHPETISLAGRTYPLGTSIFAHLSYQIFDFLRFTFTCAPIPIRKYRPSGNFTTFRASAFQQVGGYPEVTVNEDGLMGQKLDQYAKHNRKTVMFHLKLYVGHHVKKFEKVGGIRAILFYFYTLGNLFPVLKPLLKPIEYRAGLVFEGKLEL